MLLASKCRYHGSDSSVTLLLPWGTDRPPFQTFLPNLASHLDGMNHVEALLPENSSKALLLVFAFYTRELEDTVLAWSPAKAESETRSWVQGVCLAGDPR